MKPKLYLGHWRLSKKTIAGYHNNGVDISNSQGSVQLTGPEFLSLVRQFFTFTHRARRSAKLKEKKSGSKKAVHSST